MAKLNGSGDSKIKTALYKEVTLIIALVGIVSSIIFWVSSPQNEMQIEIVKLQAQIENNQTVTVALDKIKNNDFVEIHKSIEQIETRQIEVLQALAAINQQLLIQ